MDFQTDRKRTFSNLIFKITLVVAAIGQQSWASAEFTDSMLLDAEKQEIVERARAETLARENQKEQERLQMRRQELAQKINEHQRRVFEYKNLQQKNAEQLSAIEAQNNQLQAEINKVSKEISLLENQARTQEALALKARTQLEETNKKLQEKNGALNDRKAEVGHAIEKNRQLLADWTVKIANVQSDIVKSELARIEYERILNRAAMQSEDLGRMLTSAERERDLLLQQNNSIKIRKDQLAVQNDLAATQIKKIEAEQAKINLDLRNAQNEYMAQSKKLQEQTIKIETARSEVQKERLRHQMELRSNELLVNQMREKNEDLGLILVDEAADASQAKLELLKSREHLTSYVANSIKTMPNPAKVISFQEKQIVAPANPSNREQISNTSSEVSTDQKKENVATVPVEPVVQRAPAQQGQRWKLTRLCNLYSEPNTKSLKQKKLVAETEVTAQTASQGFVQVVDAAGDSGYVLISCGRYLDAN